MSARRAWRTDRDEKASVMLPQVLPLGFDVIADIEDDRDIRTDARRCLLSNIRLSNLHNGEGRDGLGHSSPSTENHSAIFALPGFESKDGILHILPDLVSRFETEEVEITEEVVVKREELKVQFRES